MCCVLGLSLCPDRPSAPGNLSLAVLAPLQLQLSWTAPFSHPGVNITYTINITALDQDNETEVGTVQSETVHNSTAYILRMDVPNCNWYQFIVTAANQAGASDPSDPITGILPMCKSFPPPPPPPSPPPPLSLSLSRSLSRVQLAVAPLCVCVCVAYLSAFHASPHSKPQQPLIIPAKSQVLDY